MGDQPWTIQKVDKNILRMLALKNITRGKIMKKLLVRFLKYLTKNEEQAAIFQPELQQRRELDFETKKEAQETLKEELQPEVQIIPPIEIEDTEKKTENTSKNKISRNITVKSFEIRDIMEIMGVPLVALSKNRTAPIIYDDGKLKVRISCHPPHYIASIYDLDIIQFVAGKMQEIFNSSEDISPRTIVFPRHELFKAIRKHDGKKEEKDLKASLSRLKLTGIETTIHNEDGRYDAGFGLLDSWGYTDRKDIKEIKITLSNWLYEVVCTKGSLLKVPQEYFEMTSGLKKVLYRIARKHVGIKNYSWDFSIEDIRKKSGSEQEFKKFKYDLKKVVSHNDLPDYFIEWIEDDGKTFVRFINRQKYLEKTLKSASANK